MPRVPFGISRFDEVIDGGAPRGSLVVLAGELGAGAREFAFTSAAMTALARADTDLFETYYGTFEHEVDVPPEVHYVSMTDPPSTVRAEMGFALAADILDAVKGEVEFCDLSAAYFKRSRVPMAWYTDGPLDINHIGDIGRRRGVLGVLAEYLSEHAEGNLVVIDSLTDLVDATDEEMTWTDITLLLKGLAVAAADWGGLIQLVVNTEAVDEERLARAMDAAHGSLIFEWDTGGNERTRTLYVKSFRGVLSRLEDEEIIRFDTDIYDHGFDITGVRRLR
ncbi:MAG: RAD55 family ATPase [Halobacteriales archaeon]